jgi:hypothetical protein
VTWPVRYQIEGDAEPVREDYETKQQARDRFFTVRQFKGVLFAELRNPDGKIWFRDHYFDQQRFEEQFDDAESEAVVPPRPETP